MADKKVIKKNTTVKKKVGKDPEQVLQEGEPIPPRFSTANQVGLNVGVTINLGDFQSLRIDCWISEEVKEGDNRQEIFNSLVKEIRDNIDYVSEKITKGVRK